MDLFFKIFATILIMVIALLLTFYLYYKIRRKMYHKFLPELIIVGGAFLFSLIMKFLIAYYINFQSIGELSEISVLLQSIYNAIGGLTFEGLEEIDKVSENVGGILQCLYYGSSLYAGVVVLFILSAKASYEFFSSVVLRSQSWSKKDIYIFTCLTNNTLCLAKDIKKKYKDKNNNETKNKDCLIIFSSHSIAPFDRLDDNCREAMASGFLYLSYPHTSKTITQKLHIKEKKDRRIVVFAYSSKDDFPIEEENMDIVFDDISARIIKHDKHEIEYYILTKRKINYQAYQCKYDEYKSYYKEYMKRFSINEFSTSEIIDFSKQRKIMKRIRMYSQLSFNDIKVIKKYIKNQIKCHNLRKELMDLKKSNNEKCEELEKEIKDLKKSNDKKCEKLEKEIKDLKKSNNGKCEKLEKEIKDLKKSNDKKCEELEKEIKKYEDLISAGSGNIHTIFKDFNFDKIFNSRFTLYVWNEAKSTANQTIDTILTRDFAERFVMSDNNLNVWTIGFGGTAVSITDELFINSSYLIKTCDNGAKIEERELKFKDENKDGEKIEYIEKITKANKSNFRSKDFFVNVFDPNAKDLSGIYAAEHKSYTCTDDLDNDKEYNSLFTKLCNEIMLINKETNGINFNELQINLIKRYFKNSVYPIYLRNKKHKDISLEMPLPMYNFNEISATTDTFYDILEQNMTFYDDEVINNFIINSNNKELKELFNLALSLDIKDTPNIFVVATGDDYRNVVITNSIVNIFAKKYELCDANSKEKYKANKKYLIINLFDKHNNNLLNSFGKQWDKEHTVLDLDYMTVFIVGNSDIIYNYNNTLDYKGAEEYHYIYQTINNKVFEIKDDDYANIGFALKSLAYNSNIKKDGKDYNNIIDSIISPSNANSLDNRIKELLYAFFKDILNIINLDNPFKEKSKQDFIDNIMKELNRVDRVKTLKFNFNKLELWKKESNKSAALYGDIFIKIFNKEITSYTSDNLIELFAYLSAIEHNRWNRLHIADGWDLVKNKMGLSEFNNDKIARKKYYDSLKLHDSIKIFDEVGDSSILYDTYNVLYGLLRESLKINKD